MSNDLIDKTLFFLHEVEKQTRSSEQLEALRTAKLALHFIQSLGESHDLEDFLQNFNSDAPLSPLLSFPTREEAEAWLKNHPAPPHGAIIGVGDALYSVGFARKSGLRVLVQIPSAADLQGADEQEDHAEDPSEET